MAGGATGMSRRTFMNVSVAGMGAVSVAGLAACTGTAAKAASPGRALYVGGLADVVLAAFKTHRLVGLGEAHDLQEHHDALTLLLTDPRLPGVVDDIVVEFGNALYQPTIDRFTSGQAIADADLRLVWRNTTQSPLETWDEPVYEQFYRMVRAVNAALPPNRQIRVLLGDPPLDWSKITKPGQLATVAGPERDQHAASVVKTQVLDKGRRALICYGAGHLHHGGSLAGALERQTGERMYLIADAAPFLAGDPGGLAAKLAGHPRNTVIPAAGTWLGSFDAGLFSPDAQGSPHGQQTNPACGRRLGSVIDAALYLGQPGELTSSWWNPAIFLDQVYWQELQRRNALTGNGVDLERYRQEHLPQFPQLVFPRAVECGIPGDR